MILQSTKKLQDFIGIKTTALPEESESFDAWHGNIFMIGRKKCLLLTHNESLYSMFFYGVTKKDVKNFPSMFKSRLQTLLRKDDFTLQQIIMIGESLEEITYTKTSDRSVTGNMNDMVHMLKYFNMTEDELSLCARISHTPYSRGKFYFPEQILKRLIEEKSSKDKFFKK